MGTTRHKKPPIDEAKRHGRIVLDDRGHNVWQWNDEQIDSTTIMLQRLDNKALAIELTDELARPDLDGRPQTKADPGKPDFSAHVGRDADHSAGHSAGQSPDRGIGPNQPRAGSAGKSDRGFNPYDKS